MRDLGLETGQFCRVNYASGAWVYSFKSVRHSFIYSLSGGPNWSSFQKKSKFINVITWCDNVDLGVPNITYHYGFCLQFTKYGIVFIWQWWWQINSGKMLCFQRRNKETALSNFARCCNLVSLVPMLSSISNVSNILKIVILESIGINGNIFLNSATSPNTIE